VHCPRRLPRYFRVLDESRYLKFSYREIKFSKINIPSNYPTVNVVQASQSTLPPHLSHCCLHDPLTAGFVACMHGRDGLRAHYGDCTAPEKHVIEIALCLADIAISNAFDVAKVLNFRLRFDDRPNTTSVIHINLICCHSTRGVHHQTPGRRLPPAVWSRTYYIFQLVCSWQFTTISYH